jgi:hypothetical protein
MNTTMDTPTGNVHEGVKGSLASLTYVCRTSERAWRLSSEWRLSLGRSAFVFSLDRTRREQELLSLVAAVKNSGVL